MYELIGETKPLMDLFEVVTFIYPFSPKVYYLVSQACKKVNSSKNGRFRYEVIGETQPEMELKWKFIYPFG